MGTPPKKTATGGKSTRAARGASAKKASSGRATARRASPARATKAGPSEGPSQSPRMGTFEDLFAEATPEVRRIGDRLRRLVREIAPGARETVYLGWRIALYKPAQGGREFCGIQPATGHCNFYLSDGAYLKDPDGLLEGTGKAIRHVSVRAGEEIPLEGITELVRQGRRRVGA